MIRRLLVPLDGSPFGERAVAAAITIARRHGALIELGHVHAPLWLPHDGVPHIDPAFELDRRRRAETWLAERADRLAAESGVEVHATFLLGDTVQALELYLREPKIDLVVMTTHGRSGISRAWLGSVADGVVRSSPVPVLLIRVTDDRPTGEPGEFHRVLVPLDGSELARSILEPALALSPLGDAKFDLLTVVQPPPVIEPFPDVAVIVDRAGVERAQQAALASSVHAAEAYLGRIARDARLRAPIVKVTVHTQPARGILEYADEIGADLIALATHGRSGLARVFIGSVADKVVRGSRSPVLIVRPPWSDGAGARETAAAPSSEER
jgi:nucleotide-binding universal stress UspA family protein